MSLAIRSMIGLGVAQVFLTGASSWVLVFGSVRRLRHCRGPEEE
jgi:hypothetical protein